MGAPLRQSRAALVLALALVLGSPADCREEEACSPALGHDPDRHAGPVPDAIAPAHTRGEIEPPAGEKDMGGSIAGVYTTEQQLRLFVDEWGDATPIWERPAPPTPAVDCSDRGRPNPCAKFHGGPNDELECALGGVDGLSAAEVKFLRNYMKTPAARKLRATETYPASREHTDAPGMPQPIEGAMSLQPNIVRVPQHTDANIWEIARKLEEMAVRATQRRGWGFELGQSLEPLHLARYTKGGFYRPHRDAIDGFVRQIGATEALPEKHRKAWGGRTWEGLDAGDRAVSVVVQLSDRSEYQAGELDMILGTGAEPQLALPEINAIRANATVFSAPTCPGDVVFYPSLTVHKVNVLQSGEREALIWWIPPLHEDGERIELDDDD